MDKLLVRGGNKLNGSISIGGSKNAVLPIMTATLIVPGNYKITNVPNLRDTKTMIRLLEIIGSKVSYKDNTLIVDTTKCNNPCAPYELVKTMRASILVMGPLVAKYGKAKISQPGGCDIGSRPIDFHLSGLEKMGAESCAKLVYDHFNDVLSKTDAGRCKVVKVECFENDKNSSIYYED